MRLNPVFGQVGNINIDSRTVAVMSAEYAAATATESAYHAEIDDILAKYGVAEVAAAGIFASKFLDRKAMTSLGILSDGTENYYYRRIYKLVGSKIIPLTLSTGERLIKFPHRALYWGSYLIKICAEVKTLCMQFESVVTNGSLSFSSLHFLELNPNFQTLIDITKYGGVNWDAIWTDIASVPGNFSKENLNKDLETLFNIGSGLAVGGFNNLSQDIMDGYSGGETFSQKAQSVSNVVNNIYGIYRNADGDVLNLFKNYMGESPTAASLFSISSYNMTGWISDYLSNAAGAYYTQRWYIGRTDSGNELVGRYDPPTDNNSVTSGSHWTRFDTTDPYFYPNSSQLNQVRNNSKTMSGWTDARIAQLNAQDPNVTYNVYYSLIAYVISRGGKQIRKAYAYNITVYRSWNITEEVYEEYFDSYTMDLNTFLYKMQALVEDYNRNENGYVYSLKSDARKYYELATNKKVEGSETAVISMTCSDDVKVGEGSTQYKCKTCNGSLDAHSKECAMLTTVTDNDLDLTELKEKLTEKEEELVSKQDQLITAQNAIKTFNQLLQSQDVYLDSELTQTYKGKLAEATKLADDLQAEIKQIQEDINEMSQALEQAAHDNDVETDDYYRIPAIMRDACQTYGLTWVDQGSWVGYTFIRKATAANIKGELTFSAKLSVVRKPQFFMGVRIHRAIMKITWELRANYTDTQIVETLPLTGLSDNEKVNTVNQHLSEHRAMHPGCIFQVEYIKAEPTQSDTTEDPQHLLWASDRIEIAQKIEGRLVKIYADLVALNKFMGYKLDIVDVMNQYGVLPNVNDEEGRRRTLVRECFYQWKERTKNQSKR